ncbi:MAG: LysR family transcriptional regulator [Erysipelotrichaceae bacterium]|nr:LysR family transcriptional regulator [Erysipelotrichaceae bacterium]MDO5109323.1 LysR family transcriptional regulator [Erysipelotrichaceae bacterium]
MELRTLRYFLAVAAEENMTAAANSLHISQPALSYQIAELEKELGKQLFLRSGRKMILTEEGMFLRSRAEEIIDLADRTGAQLSEGTSEVHGDIYIGAAESLSLHSLALVIADFRKEYPHVVFHFHSGTMDDVYERLNRGAIDFAVVVEPFSPDGCEVTAMPSADRMGIVIRKDHPLAAKKTVSASDLYDLPLILTTRRNMNEKQVAEMIGIPPEHFNVSATGNLIFNLAILAEHEIGAILTLEGLISTHESSLLTFVPLDPPVTRRLVFACKQYRPMSRAARLFYEKVKENFS